MRLKRPGFRWRLRDFQGVSEAVQGLFLLYARFTDLGPDYHNSLIHTERRMRSHVAQLAAMCYHVTL
jgi:D-lyxose ketol-isomerase